MVFRMIYITTTNRQDLLYSINFDVGRGWAWGFKKICALLTEPRPSTEWLQFHSKSSIYLDISTLTPTNMETHAEHVGVSSAN